jgi:predicted metal-dependent hydrolase
VPFSPITLSPSIRNSSGVYLSGSNVAPPHGRHSIFDYQPGGVTMPSSVSQATAEIVANQSQDYVDEQLLEYQNQIAQLQGRTIYKTKLTHIFEILKV